MKLVLLITLLSLTIAQAFLFRGPSSENSIQAPNSISEYLTAFFAHFGLQRPNQMIPCFNERNTALYFRHIDEVSQLTQAAENRDNTRVHLIWGRLVVLHRALEPLCGCVAATQDFSDLLRALGARERNPQLFMLAQYLYYQANFGQLSQELPRLTRLIDNNDWRGAGDIAANITQEMANSLRTRGLALNALNGLWNGVHIGLGLPDAQSVWGCWDNTTATIRLQFIYGMATAVAGGSWRDAAVNTERWYRETGNDLLRRIPSSNWECWGNSTDTRLESERLGVDLTSDRFHEMVMRYVHSQQRAFWTIQNGIRDSMDQHNFLHAGDDYAHLLRAATQRSNSDS